MVPDSLYPPFVGDLSTMVVDLKDDQQYSVTTKVLSNDPFILIADFVKPGKYKLTASLNAKDSIGGIIALAASEDIEMKTDDLFVAIRLK